MSIKISGILPGPTGEPAAHIGITLRAVKTSLTVVITLESNSITGADGSYSFNVEPGQYDVLLWVDGINARNVGTINVYSDSLPGTLNNFLTALREEDGTPEIIRQLEQLRAEALQAALEAKESKDEATHQAGIATSAAENAAQETADLITAVVKDDADRAESAREGAETAKLAVDTMVAEVAQHHTEVGQLASVASNSAVAAAGSATSAAQSASESESSKNAAAQSEETAVAGAEAAGNSATAAAGDKAATEGFRDEAEEFAVQAKASAESIDVSALEEQINQKVSQTVFDEAIGGKASTQQLADGLANKLTVQSTFLSTDLNLAVTSGIYHPTVAAANLPLPVLGVMEVYVRLGGTNLVQIYHVTANVAGSVNRHFVRIGTLSAGEWIFNAWEEQHTSLSMGTLGIGLASIADIANFDWLSFPFLSGANYLASYNSWLNAPPELTFNAGTRVSITVDYIATNGTRIGLTVIPDTGAQPNYRVFKVLSVGAPGSRVFTVRQDWNSAIPVPISGGGTGAATPSAARAALGMLFTIMYPEGTQASPYSFPVNTRRVYVNPFVGRVVKCVAEVLVNGVWGDPGWIYYYSTAISGSFGTVANQTDTLANIVVLSGTISLSAASNTSGGPHNSVTSPTTPLPLRIKIFTID
ncbi:prophage tail fiber N-terminal domain-containing protein [Yersinia mollaretii]|uniref:prophage tail fiber N-terminal domain-containing protein n=1 Tax=Yersinia mollaretii TaxID=33060 RepID=UPI001C971D84|nr:prophage tail fiber N-terminal domain-containing protein [Yersinia mollaretii]